MKHIIVVMISGLVLASCGANGEPTKPVVTGSQTVTVNSNSGLSTSTTIGVVFGSN